jgi:hypothetical protein
MRAAHHHRYTSGSHRVSHAVGLGDHSGHTANAHQSDLLFSHEPGDGRFIHWSRVPVDQQHLMARRRQCLQQEHPQVRHKVPCHTVVGAIEQDSQGLLSILWDFRLAFLAGHLIHDGPFRVNLLFVG